MARFVEVIYKCSCMKAEEPVHVKERGQDEGVEAFMKRMQIVIGNDHRKRSPLCMRTSMEYAKLVMPPDGVVGGAIGGTA